MLTSNPINSEIKEAAMQLLPRASFPVTAAEVSQGLGNRWLETDVTRALNSLTGERKIWKDKDATPAKYSTWAVHYQNSSGADREKLLLNERIYELLQRATAPVTEDQVLEALADSSLTLSRVKKSLWSLSGFKRIWKYNTNPVTFSTREVAKQLGEPVGVSTKTAQTQQPLPSPSFVPHNQQSLPSPSFVPRTQQSLPSPSASTVQLNRDQLLSVLMTKLQQLQTDKLEALNKFL